MKKLKFTTFITAEPYAQRFSNKANKYVLSPDKKSLVLEGQIDVDELINSAYDSTVDDLLEQFLNVPNPRAEVAIKQAQDESVYVVQEPKQSHVDSMNFYHAEADRLRKQYQIADNLSDGEVFNAVAEKLKQLKEWTKRYGINGTHKDTTDSSIDNSNSANVSCETAIEANNKNGGENK